MCEYMSMQSHCQCRGWKKAHYYYRNIVVHIENYNYTSMMRFLW